MDAELSSELFGALLNYQSTNPKNDEVVRQIVSEEIVNIMHNMEKNYSNDNLSDLKNQYYQKGLDSGVFVMKNGESSADKMCKLLDMVNERYSNEITHYQNEGKPLSPFVKGLISKSSKKQLFVDSSRIVMDDLNDYRNQISMFKGASMIHQTVSAYVISVKDIFQMVYGPKISELMKSKKTEAAREDFSDSLVQ